MEAIQARQPRVLQGDEAGRFAQSRPAQAPVRALLALMLLVNLAASLYQLPLNRVIERRLCRAYYGARDVGLIGPHGGIDEKLCKLDEIQQDLARIQGVMETAWVVGGGWPMATPRLLPKLMHRLPPQTFS